MQTVQPTVATVVTLVGIGLGAGLIAKPALAQSPPPSLAPLQLAQERSPLLDLEDPDFWADQCLTLAQQDDPEKTLTSCEQAIVLDPDRETGDLWLARSEALLQSRAYPEAIASLNQVIQREPNSSIAIAQQCVAWRAMGEDQTAIDTCEAALRLNGNWGRSSPALAWYEQGRALQTTGQWQTAVAALGRAFQTEPDSALYEASYCGLAIEVGVAAPNCGSLRTIADIYDAALALAPTDSTLWFQQGLLLEQLGQYDRSLQSYQQAATLRPERSQFLARQCAVLNHLQDYETALAACEAAFGGDQQWGAIGPAYGWVQQSNALIGLEDYETALAAAERAVAIPIPQADPDIETVYYAPAFNAQAVSLWHLGRIEEAETAIHEAINTYYQASEDLDETFRRSYPESVVFYYRGLITSFYNSGRIAATNAAKEENYSNALVAYGVALSLYSDLCPEFKASDSTELVISYAADKNDVTVATDETWLPEVHSHLCNRQDNSTGIIEAELLSEIYTHQAIAYLRTEQYQSAIESAEEATASDNQSFTAWYNRGWIWYNLDWIWLEQNRPDQNSYSEAFEAYQRANAISPDNVYVLTGQGMALVGMGCPATALTVFDQVLNLYPNYALAEQERQNLVKTFAEGAGTDGEDCP